MSYTDISIKNPKRYREVEITKLCNSLKGPKKADVLKRIEERVSLVNLTGESIDEAMLQRITEKLKE